MTVGISAIVTTYRNDDPDEFRTAVRSIHEQTRKPDELVIVKDGPVPSVLEAAVSDMVAEADYPTKVFELPENLGHGGALRKGIREATKELVAIMDADDISVENRFELQEPIFEEQDVDVVGGHIEEFDTDPTEPHAVREVPETHNDIRSMAMFRCPINQTTVMARRSAILEGGNYRDVDRMEDYELWARMLVSGAKFHNIQRVLAKVRAGTTMYERRGSLEYAREEIRLQAHFVSIGFVSPFRALLNATVRIPPRLLPNSIRGIIYRKLLRSQQQ